ncbi:MATE family efflux transporter [Erysipelotrichaceae bacterium RD49]|nr:MATE family efflux transporter [Erysipelotrichaceae bacterium RD49]
MFKQQSLTSGPYKRALILFAIPLFGAQLFQTLYNTCDTIIVGHLLGDLALASVGSVASLFDLVVGFSTGFGQGLGVVAAQKFGAQDFKGFKRVVGLSIVLSLIVSILLSAGIGFFLPQILTMMKTDPAIFEMAYSYISVIFAGLTITVMYNLLAGMLRSAGDSTTPLVILLISSVLNIILDLVFVSSFQMGVAGTAWATLAAQLISLIICAMWVIAKRKDLIPSRHDFRWDANLASNLASMGMSMALMSSIVSLGTVILQTGINGLGYLIVSGHTAARRLFAILNLPVFSVMMAVSPYVAQNIGAREYDRVQKGIRFANRLGLYYGVLLTIVIYIFANQIVTLISGSENPEVLATGSLYLKTNVPFFPVLAVLLNLRISLQSMEQKMVPVVSSIIELVGKVLFTLFIVPGAGYLGVCFTEPVVWIAMCLFLAYYYLRNPLFKEHHIPARIF